MLVVMAVSFAVPRLALGQSPGPIPPVVFDIRGFWPSLGRDPITAKDLGIDALDLPSRGLGGAAGIHLYPIRSRRFALGIGGEAFILRGKAQQEGTATQPVGLIVRQEVKGFSGNVSLNAGDRNGWSYLTGGMGPVTFKTYKGDTAPADAAPHKMTINMGGGARWFVTEHVAVAFDVRFYLTRPEEITGSFPGRQRLRLVFLAGGVSFK
jgi:hypothetical protein